MAICTCKFHSQILGSITDVTVFIPNIPFENKKHISGEQAKYQVLYLFHGYSGDHQDWITHTNIIRYAQERQLAVVMPSAWDSFYCDKTHGKAFWTYISEELPYFINSIFSISNRREDTFAAGLSMGGYGAIKLGLLHPEKFCAVASLSGVVDLTVIDELTGPIIDSMKSIFGSKPMIKDDLKYMLEQKLRNNSYIPDIYLACGTDDFLYQANQEFFEKVNSLGVSIKYEEEAGAGHEWDFWDKYIQRILEWLPLKRNASCK